jgi:hypothetical protein
MTKDLDNLLCAKYPEIFRDRHAPMNQTCMCWGFDCGDGWFALIDTLCASLMTTVKQARDDYRSRQTAREKIDTGHITAADKGFAWSVEYASDASLAKAKAEQEYQEANIPVAVQVKEKFGGLRFYVNGGTETHQTMIYFAETMSYRICEECGTTKDTKCWRDGWHRTLCVPCAMAAGRHTGGGPNDDNDFWGV